LKTQSHADFGLDKKVNDAKVIDNPSARPNTEFLPSASQEFEDKIKPGRIRPAKR